METSQQTQLIESSWLKSGYKNSADNSHGPSTDRERWCLMSAAPRNKEDCRLYSVTARVR